MKKLFLFLLLGFMGSIYAEDKVELDFSLDSFCDLSPKIQKRDGFLYLPNQEKLYSGENLCVYLSNGNRYSYGYIKKGLRTGKWTYWYENGQISSEKNYKDNKLDGRWIEWDENGQKKEEENYKDGKRDGKWTSWYSNGQIRSEKNHKDGIEGGKWISWDEDGQKLNEKNYKDGYIVAFLTTYKYYDNGQLKSEINSEQFMNSNEPEECVTCTA